MVGEQHKWIFKNNHQSTLLGAFLSLMSIAEIIKIKDWDNRVKRPGFLLPKMIINEAEVLPITILNKLTIQTHNILWVGEMNLYDKVTMAEADEVFAKAFKVQSDWPKNILQIFTYLTAEKNLWIERITKIDWNGSSSHDLLQVYTEYRKLLCAIQKYYIIAVPLTNYCTQELSKEGINPNIYATPIFPLDLDALTESLRDLQSTSRKPDKLLAHTKKFAWIKNNYHLIAPYTIEEVEVELQSPLPKPSEHLLSNNPIIIGLQTGIYLRNRMKEMSQQIWQNFEPAITAFAKKYSISREYFLTLTPNEVCGILQNNQSLPAKEIIEARQQCFTTGFINGELVLLTGNEAQELITFFSDEIQTMLTEVTGTPSSPGHVINIARVINNIQEIQDLQAGEILITSMTTPDFIPVMKRASAIVTDEGGLSCHAAIVARELRVPCVVGTKNATKIFKTGEKISVNADTGVIKKI